MAKKIHRYHIRTYLNATHAVRWKTGSGVEHPHTWEIICEINHQGKSLIKFDDIEKSINQMTHPLSGQFLNTIPPFDKINPTLENLADYLFDQISRSLDEIGCSLVEIEVGESPTRFYSVLAN
ncbi:MAG: 6-carboxytetrahydropterin synthase [Oenococcus sp.]|uniref:6-carboxytetrahydropterin synthase n=1 Tax=Oenococcus sp. TaxID=1979414 RepID=UPI0039EC7FCE